MTVSDVLQMDMSKQTKKANAFFAGLGNTKRIVLADTLLNEFSADEIEVVLAHELGHQVHGDIWKLIGLGALTSALTAWAVQPSRRAADRALRSPLRPRSRARRRPMSPRCRSSRCCSAPSRSPSLPIQNAYLAQPD